MTIHDFPQMPFPEVETHQLSGFKVEVIQPSSLEGQCENCKKRNSSHIFNIGTTLHHLCKKCFDKMLSEFQKQTKE